MREVPFLMSTMMVQAILAGRKTQTRRIQNPQQDPAGLHTVGVGRPKAKPGDIIWVRESCAIVGHPELPYRYKADHLNPSSVKWTPSIHMPKDAARIWLRCTDVKVQRAQDISEEDAIAEGIFRKDYGRICGHGDGNWQDAMHCPQLPYIHESHQQRAGWHWGETKHSSECYETARHAFGALWQSIHNAPPKLGQPDGRWEANPWVWAYSFEVLSTTGKPKNI